VGPLLYGTARGPDANETGWKDTAKSIPGEVLTVVARWDGRWADCANGTPQNPGDTLCIAAQAAAGPGVPLAQSDYWQPVTGGPYVWHCHIVDHEDNEMMRPSLVIPVRL
jgi:FtsP/CotA-like multicopper oxidase with cupredoxin domain